MSTKKMLRISETNWDPAEGGGLTGSRVIPKNIVKIENKKHSVLGTCSNMCRVGGFLYALCYVIHGL